MDIALMDQAFGPTCDRPTMEMSLLTFDLGTLDGLGEAKEMLNIKAWGCVCDVITCSREQLEEVLERVRLAQSDPNRREREGLDRVGARLLNHRCLNYSVGVELYKSGYTCGFMTGVQSHLLLAEHRERFTAVFKGDAVRVDAVMACMEAKPADGN